MVQNRNEGLFNELSKLYSDSTGHKLTDAKKYAAGEELYRQGEEPKGIYYIKKGAVKITHNDGTPVVIHLAKHHDFIGYLSLLKHREYHSSATAVEASDIYFIPKKVFLEGIQKDLKFTNLFIEILCSRVDAVNRTLIDSLSKNVRERLAILLLTLDHNSGHASNQSNSRIGYRKKDIAAILNVKAETLSRSLSHLQKEGMVKLHSDTNSIEISDKTKLLMLIQLTD